MQMSAMGKGSGSCRQAELSELDMYNQLLHAMSQGYDTYQSSEALSPKMSSMQVPRSAS